MASAQLKTFLEDRLRALDPSIDLDAGSPAQVQFIEPVITYLGTDPFETDVDSFLTDRFAQEFPDIFAGDPGVIRDTFVKPLILFLDPFKREIETIKRNQSLQDPTVLSDDDADALVANVFDERSSGGFATGVGRILFSNPTNVQIEITNRFFTADGLGYFPTNPISITAEEMVFNKSGSLYFLDVAIKAETEGAQYNIDVNSLSGVDGVFGNVKVTNLSKFTNGDAKVDTPTFVAQAREALNERSMVTRRGATARLNDVFQTELRAVQIIGSKDEEMERDILVALSPGHQWITGLVTIWQNMALVQANVIDGDASIAPSTGDTLYVYLNSSAFPAVPQLNRFVRLKVEQTILGPLSVAAPFEKLYLVRWSGSYPLGVSVANGVSLVGGFAKVGTIAISSIPTIGTVSGTVANDAVHVYGHTDFYIRPILQSSSTAVITQLSDSDSLVERQTLTTLGLSSPKNKVRDLGSPTMNFNLAGVEPGDLLVIETGDDIGTYPILFPVNTDLYINQNLTASQTGIRYRIIKKINVDPFEPKIVKFPFDGILANDLQTTIGSNLFRLASNDVLGFNAAIGDTVRVLNGLVAGDYTITGFDPVLGGKGIIVNRAAAASLAALSYQIFTKQEPVQRPLVRIKELTLLDSSKQSTGITVPYADAVGVTSTFDFTSARVRAGSGRASGFVLPSFATTAHVTFLTDGNLAAGSGDRRYSLGFDTPVGTYKSVQFPDTTLAELDYHATPGTLVGDALDPASYFVAVAEFNDETTNFPPIDPHPGECLSIKEGPNKGEYLIKDVIKFKHKLSTPSRTVWTYFIKIYDQFPVDVYSSLFEFLNTVGGGASVTELPINSQVTYPTFFQTLHNSLGTKLNSALTTLGVASPPSAQICQSAIDSLTFINYEWGDPARGVLRSYFISPTRFEMRTGDSGATKFSFTTSSGDALKFRPDPNRYRKYEFVPPRLTSDADPRDYPRDMDISVTLTYNTQTANFAVGSTLHGAESGSTATIVSDSDSGATGTLILKNLVGEFTAGEIITDDATGSATAGVTANIQDTYFTDTSRSPMVSLGVTDLLDWVTVHEEVFFHGTDRNHPTAVQVTAGSNIITAPTTSGNIFTSDMVGNLVSIEQGQDKGIYRVVKFVDGKNLIIDHTFTQSTPPLLAQGILDSWGFQGGLNKLGSTFMSGLWGPFVNKYITVYGMPYDWMGSWQITSNPDLDKVAINKIPPNFPASIHFPGFDAHFVITDAPPVPVSVAGRGTELYGVSLIRMYEGAEKDIQVASTYALDLSISKIFLSASPSLRRGYKQLYRIYRKDIRRVTPSEMELNAFGPLSYFDTEVVSFSPQVTANLKERSYLTIDAGTYSSLGYTHIPDDRTLTYSMQEEGLLLISPRILPVGAEDSTDNLLTLVGSSIQIAYEQSDLVRRIQEFADSTEDRVTTANMLVRHFLPAYVSYNATYSGGSAPSVVAADIIAYIDNLPVETAIDVSEMEKLVDNRGGNPITPTFVQTIIHDWSRKLWLEFSDNALGGTTTDVPYDGTPRVSVYIPGPDASGQNPLPSGERINLIRQ